MRLLDNENLGQPEQNASTIMGICLDLIHDVLIAPARANDALNQEQEEILSEAQKALIIIGENARTYERIYEEGDNANLNN